MRYFCFFSRPTITALLLLLFLPSFGQINWNNINLTGKKAKILKTPNPLRFTLSATGAVATGKTQDQIVSLEDVKNVLHSESVRNVLLEKFAGEYFLGGSTGSNIGDINLTGESSTFIYGFQLAKSIGKQFEAGAGISFFKQNWAGEYPIKVVPFGDAQPYTKSGTISSNTSYLLLNANTTYFLQKKVFRPFLTVGVQVGVPGKSTLESELEGISLQLKSKEQKMVTAAFGGAGVRVVFLKNLFAQALVAATRFPSQNYAPMIQIGLGGGF